MLKVRASEVGGCPRFLALKALGMPLERPSPYVRRKVLDKGDSQEDEALAWLVETHGGTVLEGSRQMSLAWAPRELPGVMVTGHIDGLWCQADSSLALLEIKAAGQKRALALGWDRPLEEAWASLTRQYQWQVAIYSQAMLRVVEGELAYLLKLWKKPEYRLHRFSLTPLLPGLLHDLVQTLALVKAAVDRGDAMTIAADPNEFGCSRCAARYHCWPEMLERELTKSDQTSEVLTVGEVSVADMKAMEKYRQSKELGAKAEELKEEAQRHFRKRLEEAGVDLLDLPGLGKVKRYPTTVTDWDAINAQFGGKAPTKAGPSALRFTLEATAEDEPSGE